MRWQCPCLAVASALAALTTTCALADDVIFRCVDREGIKRIRNYPCESGEREVGPRQVFQVIVSRVTTYRPAATMTNAYRQQLDHCNAAIDDALRQAGTGDNASARLSALVPIIQVSCGQDSNSSMTAADRQNYCDSVKARLMDVAGTGDNGTYRLRAVAPVIASACGGTGAPAPSANYAPTTPVSTLVAPSIPRGAINVRTGQFYPGAAGGLVNPQNGQFYPDVGGGYINPQNGQFMPKQ